MSRLIVAFCYFGICIFVPKSSFVFGFMPYVKGHGLPRSHSCSKSLCISPSLSSTRTVVKCDAKPRIISVIEVNLEFDREHITNWSYLNLEKQLRVRSLKQPCLYFWREGIIPITSFWEKTMTHYLCIWFGERFQIEHIPILKRYQLCASKCQMSCHFCIQH